MKHIISLGAGVQSSTMALMAAKGEITPMPDCAVFADTQNEPASVYKWIDWLEKQLPFPVYRVSKGDLSKDAVIVRTSEEGGKYTKPSIPVFFLGVRSYGKGQRHCSADFKIDQILALYDAMRNDGEVTSWLGISLDEAHRMKPPPRGWVINRYPLVDMRITREKCYQWMKENGHPRPPRSACSYCPLHNDGEWERLKREEPEDFAKAVTFERNLQVAISQIPGSGVPYLHKSCKPLDQVVFVSDTEKSQLSFFGNECEAMCGL